MKRLILLVITMSLGCLASAQTVNRLNAKVDSISRVVLHHEASLSCFDMKVETLRDCYDRQGDMISKSNDVVSAALGAGNRNYNIFSILIAGLGALFTLMGIGLGVYIRNKEQKIINLLSKVETSEAEVEQKTSEVEEALECVEAMKAQVEDLNSLIQKDISGLYDKLKREETVFLLDRLVKVPRDIHNLSDQLLSRELQDDDYGKLLNAYNILVENNEHEITVQFLGATTGRAYFLMFFQHFLGKAINENSIKSEIISFFETGCNCAFENDIIKSTEDLLQGVSGWEENERIDVLAKYVQGVTHYGKGSAIQKDYTFVYNLIINTLKDKELMIKVWDKVVAEKVRIDSFASTLKNHYNEESLISKIDNDLSTIPSAAKK